MYKHKYPHIYKYRHSVDWVLILTIKKVILPRQLLGNIAGLKMAFCLDNNFQYKLQEGISSHILIYMLILIKIP